MVRAVDPLIVGQVALVQCQGAVLVVLHRVEVGEVGPRDQGLRMVLAQDTRAVGQVHLVQGGRRGEIAGCPVRAGQETAGLQGVHGVGAFQSAVGVNRPARGLYGLVEMTVALQEPRRGAQDARGRGGVLVRADVAGEGEDVREEFPPAGPAGDVEQRVFREGFKQEPGGAVAGLADRVGRALRVGRVGDAGNGLDQPVDGDRPGGQGEHAVGVQQG
jgi:hypothetical protein